MTNKVEQGFSTSRGPKGKKSKAKKIQIKAKISKRKTGEINWQKKGTTRSKQFGRVEIPQEAFIGVLKISKEK